MTPEFFYALSTAGALSIACAILSVFVVLRRWAFIGEGIGHSSFGGAGIAWMLALAIPALDNATVPYVFVVIFCLLTAVLIGSLSRSGRVSTDSAIGIFMVASLAFGFLAQHIYREVRNATPQWFDNLLFGHMLMVSGSYALASVMVSVAVIVTIVFLGKEILAYCFDPLTAETSGVPARAIHYTLMLLLAVVIIIGVRVAGSVLVTAMLVLPGATALAISRNLRTVLSISIAVGLVGALAGISINRAWQYLPVGPAIVLALFAQFVVLYAITRVWRFPRPAAAAA